MFIHSFTSFRSGPNFCLVFQRVPELHILKKSTLHQSLAPSLYCFSSNHVPPLAVVNTSHRLILKGKENIWMVPSTKEHHIFHGFLASLNFSCTAKILKLENVDRVYWGSQIENRTGKVSGIEDANGPHCLIARWQPCLLKFFFRLFPHHNLEVLSTSYFDGICRPVFLHSLCHFNRYQK